MKRLRYIMLLAGLMSLSLQTIYAQRITQLPQHFYVRSAHHPCQEHQGLSYQFYV